MALLRFLILAAPAFALLAQTPAAPGTPPATAQSSELRPRYVLGPDDQIIIRGSNIEEIADKPYRVEADGTLNLPLIGRIRAAGLTQAELEAVLNQRLREFVRDPQVIVTIVQFRTDPIYMVGAFRNPGIHPLAGRRTLIETLTAVGGLQPNASRRIRLSRRAEFGPIPLPAAATDPDTQMSSVEINLTNLMETVNPAEDLELKPFDIIKASTQAMVYVSGEFGKVGAFDLADRDFLPTTQVLSLAGGVSRDADPAKAIVLRPVLGSAKRATIPVDITKILAGRANDFPLLPNDTLVVPRRGGFLSTTGRNLLVTLVPATVTAVLSAVLVR